MGGPAPRRLRRGGRGHALRAPQRPRRRTGRDRGRRRRHPRRLARRSRRVLPRHRPRPHRRAAPRRRGLPRRGTTPVGTPLVFSHNDLGAEHLLADGGTVVGVIDWTDASVSDPARDFSRLHRDFGPATHDAVLQHYQGPYGPADAERTRFFARCGLLEDAAYGLRTGADAYLRAALASFPHTFD
ncbi:phosphotransferase [Actinokineospora soli]|uniref:Phosphotransferase n=1 Tax=Actinokineospora soli TaxID=1048753 RepID=A0ABW2TJD0_9PSEU